MAQDITHTELLKVLNYEATTGKFNWCPGVPNYSRHKDEVGYVDTYGRRYINIRRQSYAAHRLVWFYVTKKWPVGNVAPINGNYLDLRFDNLKQVSAQEVSLTRQARVNPSSGMTGVSWEKSRQKWVAYITINYKRRHLGYFDHKEDAAAAYAAALEARQVGATSLPAEMAEKREAWRKDARLRSLWKRVLRHADGQTGWASVGAFIKDIGVDLHDRQTIVPLNPDRPIGPGNWKWELSLFYQFDTTTPEGRNAYETVVRERNPLRHRAKEFLKRFGLTLEGYYRMHDAQEGVCACCERPETTKRHGKLVWLAVDHCHSTGAVRGLLCNNCNQGIGQFKDSAELLRRAAAYLERHAKKTEHGAASPPPPIEERKAHHGNYSP